ncbi:PREDICTED: uncharacterized protein LOC108366710 [Rhagoletis zephyria]|uniref:uncharacterized protein LOC108366710 n=1 Tax=Rhagoletis zephyria TaxID=28612 RepID=UPI0008113CEC|nr:PREDICTED: uncharacterized protein LOC108366710 [Rhagoletis zephyria]
MQAILPILLLLCILSGHKVSADLRYRGNAVHPDYPGQCYYEELRQPIPKNQSYKPINRDGRCESIYCRQDYVIEIEFCGRHNLQPNETCRIESDMRRAYPACCPRLVCQTDSNFI